MIYILIAVGYVSNYGAVVSFQEFNTPASCQAALETLAQIAAANNSKVIARCVEKGIK